MVNLKKMAYAFDTTSIKLCLSLFPCAKFRQNKGAVRSHTLMDLRGSIPTFIKLTDGLCHEVNVLDDLIFKPGAFYIMDQPFLDFDKKAGLICDQTIRLITFYSAKDYPDLLRRVKFCEKDSGRPLIFLKKLQNLSKNVTNLYKERWKIELFFK